MEHLTTDEFLEQYPMFEDVDTAIIDGLLELCQTAAFDQCVWGNWLQAGEGWFVAHVLTLREQAFGPWEASGSDPASTAWMQGVLASGVTDFTAGSVKWSKDAGMAASMMTEPLLRTYWGQLLVARRKRVAVGLVMVT
jgi:hypothetical protein